MNDRKNWLHHQYLLYRMIKVATPQTTMPEMYKFDVYCYRNIPMAQSNRLDTGRGLLPKVSRLTIQHNTNASR